MNRRSGWHRSAATFTDPEFERCERSEAAAAGRRQRCGEEANGQGCKRWPSRPCVAQDAKQEQTCQGKPDRHHSCEDRSALCTTTCDRECRQRQHHRSSCDTEQGGHRRVNDGFQRYGQRHCAQQRGADDEGHGCARESEDTWRKEDDTLPTKYVVYEGIQCRRLGPPRFHLIGSQSCSRRRPSVPSPLHPWHCQQRSSLR